MTMKYLIPFFVLGATTLAARADRDIRLKDCPAAVREAIHANLKGGRIDDIEYRRISGKVRYEVDIDGPRNADRTLRFTAAGSLQFESEDIRLSQVPAAVRSAITAAIKTNWRIDDVDRETTSAGTRYRISVDRPGKQDLEVLFTASGGLVERRVERNDD